MRSSAVHSPVIVGRNSASVGSNGRSMFSSVSSSYHTYCGLGSARGNSSRFEGRSTYDYGIGQSNFLSSGCSGAFIRGGHRRRMSTGSCPSGYPPFGYGDGLAEVRSDGAGNGVGGVGGNPEACGIAFSSTDGKAVMQDLNDRLASYIDQVRCLEAGNAELQSKISDFHAKNRLAGEPKDYSHYYQQIEELQSQIVCKTVENNSIIIKIDNNHLNVEDMKHKLDTECGLRENVEADINGLYPILDQLASCKTDMEAEMESLQEELSGLKKKHKEELICLQECSNDVNMEISVCPGPDLKNILEEIRCKYEATIDSNHKEVAEWYEGKLEEVNQEICTTSKEAEDGSHKAIDLKHQLQALEIDLQAQCNLRDTLQVSLAEGEHRYNAQLAEIQDRISCMEQQQAELRLEMEGQDREYKDLLDAKNRLEQEIQTYRSLLENVPGKVHATP
ncbi:keratin, type I cytoskeletal 19-like [Zootoca vivipara]|uniref:keratin, type I cytoskeletal 19-like n=1 Tax=Zootoca vivipara TaxID=8524 RepID=UPI0015906728|nr:keratin, type I cytoskeletal 19-like [Zootoca vivipara]